MRERAALLLGAMGGPDPRPRRSPPRLEDPAPAVRAAAAVALGRLGDWPAAARLAGMLRDATWVVRRYAAMALRSLGSRGELLLGRALRDADRFGRRHGAPGAGHPRARRARVTVLLAAAVRLDWAILVYFPMVNGCPGAPPAPGGPRDARATGRRWQEPLEHAGVGRGPGVSILAPPTTRRPTVSESLRALLALAYPNLEVVVINDGGRGRDHGPVAARVRLGRDPRPPTSSRTLTRPWPASTAPAAHPRCWWPTRRTAARPTR